MTGGFSAFTKAELETDETTDYYNRELINMSILEEEKREYLKEERLKKQSPRNVPHNGSKIDYKLTFPQPTIRKKMAS